jgi:hypothetical protein
MKPIKSKTERSRRNNIFNTTMIVKAFRKLNQIDFSLSFFELDAVLSIMIAKYAK